VELHDDHFSQDTQDEEWLPWVGERGWILLTKDGRLRQDRLQRKILVHSGVRAFIFSDANMTGEEMGRAYCAALPRMLKLAVAMRKGFIAAVNPSGGVQVIFPRQRRGRRRR